MSAFSTRWAAVGAAVAVTLGAGGVGITQATTSSGPRSIYTPITPCRLTDTRPAPDNVGPRSTPLGPDEAYTISGWGGVGKCDLPSGTSGLSLNVTAFGPTAPTYLTVYPSGTERPVTSNLNPTPGQPPTPNAVTVGLSTSGQFDVYNRFGSVDAIVDVVGVYDDHDHDDQYYTKSQSNSQYYTKSQSNSRYYTRAEIDGSRTITQQYSPSGMTWLAATGTHTFNGCPTQPDGGNSTATMALDGIPVGSTVFSATVHVFDGSTAPTYDLYWRIARLGNGLELGLIDSVTGAGDTKAGLETHVLTPAAPFELGVGDSMKLDFRAGGVAENGICAIGITYQLPKL